MNKKEVIVDTVFLKNYRVMEKILKFLRKYCQI